MGDGLDKINHSTINVDVFLPYMSDLYRFVNKLVSTKEDVEDVLQETILVAITGYDRIRNKEKIGGWLRTVAYNLAMQLLRRRYQEVDMYPKLWSADSSGEEDLLVERLDVQHALSMLSSDDRQLLQMYVVQGYTSSEIAELRGMIASTIRWKIRGILRTLRDDMIKERSYGK